MIPVDLVVAAILAVAAERSAAPSEHDRHPTCTTWPPACGTRSATDGSSSSSRAGSPSTPSTTTDGPADRGARVVVPRARTGAAPAHPGHQGDGRWPSGSSARCPIRGEQAEWMAALEEQHLLAERALGYVELYGAYTETEARYRVDRLLALWDRMDEDDRAAFCFDPAASTGPYYVHEIHLPSVIEHARVRTTPGRSTQTNRPDRARSGHPLPRPPPGRLRPREHPDRLQRGRLLRLAGLAATCPPAERAAFVADLVAEAPVAARARPTRPGRLPALLLPPLRGRPGRPAARRRLGALPPTCCSPSRSRRRSPGCGRHRALGHRTLLITGALDLVVEPLRPLFDDIVCARLGRVGRHVHRSARRAPADRRGPGPGPGRLRRGRGPRARGVGGLRRLGERPPMLEAVGFPVAVNPEAQAGRDRPAARLARRALGEGEGGARPPLPLGPLDRRGSPRPDPRSPAAASAGSVRRLARGAGTMKALVFERNLPRFAASRVASLLGSGRGAGIGPLHLLDAEPPDRPVADWHRVRPLLSGICGSDLATLDGRSSRYFEDLVSFPFVPGHEVVGVARRAVATDHAGRPLAPGSPCGRRAGARLRPAGIEPRLPRVRGRPHRALRQRRLRRPLARACRPGSAPTPAAAGPPRGSSRTPRQLHAVPDAFTDEDAVMVEPTACAVHAALSAEIERREPGGSHRRRHARARSPSPRSIGWCGPRRRCTRRRRREARRPAPARRVARG